MSTSKAERILSSVPDAGNGFYFYVDLNQPTGDTALSLEEFSKILKGVDIKSIRFHLTRGDFERWFDFIGDDALSKDLENRRNIKSLDLLDYSDKELRLAIRSLVERRIKELKTQLPRK